MQENLKALHLDFWRVSYPSSLLGTVYVQCMYYIVCTVYILNILYILYVLSHIKLYE